jgi:hypothetical protein
MRVGRGHVKGIGEIATYFVVVDAKLCCRRGEISTQLVKYRHNRHRWAAIEEASFKRRPGRPEPS